MKNKQNDNFSTADLEKGRPMAPAFIADPLGEPDELEENEMQVLNCKIEVPKSEMDFIIDQACCFYNCTTDGLTSITPDSDEAVLQEAVSKLVLYVIQNYPAERIPGGMIGD